MNIVFFNSTKFWGGGEVFQLSLASSLSKLNPDTSILFITNHNSPLQSKAKRKGYSVLSLKINKQPLLNIKLLWDFVKYLKKQEIDCIFFSSSNDMKLGALVGKLSGIKKIIYIRGQEKPIRCNLSNRFLLSKLCTHIIFSSYATQKTSLKYFSTKSKPNHSCVIYHGINLHEYHSHDFKSVNKVPIISNVARLIPDKNQFDLIATAKILKSDGLDFMIEIVGEGSLRDSLQKEIHDAKLEDVITLKGYKEKIPEYLSSTDIFALTSSTEGFGLVIVEAMSQSVPVVAYNKSSMPELITHNENGLLANDQSVIEFAQYLKTLLLSPELSRKLGENGKRTAISRFDIDLCAREIIDKVGL